METEKVCKQRRENQQWKFNVAFYNDEIAKLKSRLQEASLKKHTKEDLIQIEHFQDQIVIQKRRLDELEHDINLSKDDLESKVNMRGVHLYNSDTGLHSNARERMNLYERLFAEFKSEINAFLCKC